MKTLELDRIGLTPLSEGEIFETEGGGWKNVSDFLEGFFDGVGVALGVASGIKTFL